MSEFISWELLGTYAGAVMMVTTLTQFTKSLSFIQKIPTQIWSFILALVVILLAHLFTTGLTWSVAAQTILNAAIVSLASNGAYSGVSSLSHKDKPSQE